MLTVRLFAGAGSGDQEAPDEDGIRLGDFIGAAAPARQFLDGLEQVVERLCVFCFMVLIFMIGIRYKCRLPFSHL
jgi:hypothetical protein